MEWLLLILAGAGAAGFGGRRFAVQRARIRAEQAELEQVRRLADEDVTLFGEQLQRLDAEVSARSLDAAARADYQRALDAYESAHREVTRLREPDEVSKITDTLATGRYALACVEARAAGRELPELRVPCFFNPQHGPSVSDVVWTRPGRGTRTVPACAQDAARVAAREQPELRMVRVGGRTVPYWEAGAAYLPYSQGYFPAATPALSGGLAWAFDPQAGATPVGGHADHSGDAGGHWGGPEAHGHELGDGDWH
jgi:hypothetical protein